MCGIFGAAKINKDKVYSEPSLKYILHRGPDGIGKYEDENIILCHSRLAIIDQKITSNQPIVSPDFVLICNGEIYNYEEIKKFGGYDYVSTSDCEAIIHVYKNFGVDGFNRLDGFYSFCLYDKKNRKLFLHKDNIGKKPLYFLADNEKLIFSSNVSAIVDNCHKKLILNSSGIKFYFQNGFISPLAAIFEGIQPVLPGEIYEIDLISGKFQKTFLEKPCGFENFDFSDDKKIQEKIEELLDKAVSKRVKNVSHPVLLFSGGVDSTVLAYYMSKHCPQLKLVSMKQPLRFLNDEPYTRLAAKKLGRKVNFVKIFSKKFYDELERFISNLDQPLALYSYYFLSALTMKAQEYGKVLFTGDAGDEVFYGYETFDKWLAKDNVLRLPKILVGPAPKIPLSDWALDLISIGLLGHAFVKVDKATAENQIECRCPYLDWDLMCFSRSIPIEYWQKHKVIKYPLKQLLIEKGFSEKFTYRKKIGFSYPFRYVMALKYPYIINYINHNLVKAREISGLEIKKASFAGLFLNFDFYWKIFILLKYLDNLKNVSQN